MKQGIHPKTYKSKIVCNCGATYEIAHTTLPEIRVEICGACHPVYTKKEKLVDTAGRIEKFKARMQVANDTSKS